jgi:hypothetical protein
MNAINVIAPYKHHGMWVFDDPRVGLVQEPFVSGADTMIDRVVAEIPNAEQGFTLIFSSGSFPDHQFDWNGDGAIVLEIGTTRRPSTWRGGSVRRCFDTLMDRRKKSMCRSKRVKPNESRFWEAVRLLLSGGT